MLSTCSDDLYSTVYTDNQANIFVLYTIDCNCLSIFLIFLCFFFSAAVKCCLATTDYLTIYAYIDR